jgi:hypothetical protein
MCVFTGWKQAYLSRGWRWCRREGEGGGAGCDGAHGGGGGGGAGGAGGDGQAKESVGVGLNVEDLVGLCASKTFGYF